MAQPSNVLLLVLGLVAGVVGGFLGGTLAAPAPAESASSDDLLVEEPVVAPVSEERIRALESEVSSLKLQLELARADMQRVPDRQEMLAPALLESEDPRGELAWEVPPDWTGHVDERVSAILQERDQAEEEARRQRQAENRKRRVSAQVERLSEELGLTPIQEQDMSRVLLAADERRSELWESVRDGGDVDRETMRASMRTIQEETQAELQVFLTAEQLAQYTELQSNRGWFGGGRRGSDRGGNRPF